MWNVSIRGDSSATGTENQIFFYGISATTTSAIGFKNGGQFASPTGAGDGWNTYLTMDTAGRGWVFREGTGGTNFTSLNNSGWILNNGVWQANASMRSPIFYDSNNTGYYGDFASTSRMNAISLDRVNVGDGTFLFTTGSGSGTTRHLNMSSSGTDPSQSHTGQSGITWGSRSDSQAYYMIYLTHGDYSGYTKLTLNWHTGIRIGAASVYGGTAFYNNSLNVPGDLIFTVGRGDNHVRVLNNLYASIFYDYNDTAYYLDPNSTSDSALRIRGGALHGPNVTWGTYVLVGGDGRQNYTNSGTTASVCSTNGNLHMDSASGYEMYLNYYDGINIYFGNGANGIIGTVSAAGNLTMTGNITAYSDIKLKTNIKTIQNALGMVSRLRGVYFDWIENGNQSIGLIAQEVQEVIPELVLENVIKNPPSFPGEEVSEEIILSVDYGKITAVLIEAFKEQQKQIEELKAQLNGN
jgi:hypothetical protein